MLWQQYEIKNIVYHVVNYTATNTEDSFIHEKVVSDDIFCILYTSGSTGVPKGVKLSHGNVLNHLTWYWNNYPYDKGEVLCSKTTVLFIDHYTETLTAVLKHQSILFLQREEVQNYPEFMNYLQNYRITRLIVVPTLLKVILMINKDSNQSKLCLRQVICSGEILSQGLAREFRTRFPYTDLFNTYGSTEDTGVISVARNSTDYLQDSDSLIGLPIVNTILYIVDKNGMLVNKADESGELWVAGKSVSKQYIDSNNNDSFIKNPFSEEEHSNVFFKSGDYVRLCREGLLFLGRIDNFVKIRGHKVSLMEVENLIRILIPEAQVLVESMDTVRSNIRKLYALITILDIPENELIMLLKKKIPDYMIPIFIVVNEIPVLLATGKVDRIKVQELISSFQNHCNYSTEELEPLSKEDQLRIVTSKVLHIHTTLVNFDKGFFEQGGDSFSVINFMNELNVLGFNITFKNILTAQTLIELIDETTKVNRQLNISEEMIGRFLTSQEKVIDIVSFTDLSEEEVVYSANKLITIS